MGTIGGIVEFKAGDYRQPISRDTDNNGKMYKW